MSAQFDHDGFAIFDPEPAINNWVDAVAPKAVALSQDPKLSQEWLRHQSTWFVGVNVLENDAVGAGDGFAPITGKAIDFCRGIDPDFAFDKAQISVCYRGYPRQDAGESDANHAFRKNRFAAHLDGLLPNGPAKRRHLQEYHGFVLGIPLNTVPLDAAPMMIWPGSHRIITDMLRDHLGGLERTDWGGVDLTDAYQSARAKVFQEIAPIPVTVPVGGTYVLHRFAIHGVAPWNEALNGPQVGRMIAYFRPDWAGSDDGFFAD